MNIAQCLGCGCTDTRACCNEETGEPCFWLRVDRSAGLGVCSECAELIERWDRVDRERQVPA